MKVWNLLCGNHHVFEGWFASEADYVQQQQSGWLQCPVCGSSDVCKGLSAPRLQGKSNQKSAAPVATDEAPSRQLATGLDHQEQQWQQAQAQWLHMARRVVAQAENVGERFADEARRIHEGDTPERLIRGKATLEETKELLQDGIAVVPLPDLGYDSLQ